MSGTIRVKFCGLSRPEDVAAAVAAEAAYVGFNFFPKSPRYVTPENARGLCLAVPPGTAKVALTADAEDAALDAILDAAAYDMLQLHGRESPERIAALQLRYGLPVMKAVGVSGPEDIAALADYAKVADQILVDAKPPRDAVLPGGNGLAFDWRLIAGLRWPVPWMLAGGLTPENVAEAVQMTGAQQVDVASGVERAPGVKDASLMIAFAKAVQ